MTVVYVLFFSVVGMAGSYCVALYGCIVVVSLASYIILRLSSHGGRWLSPIAMNITVRIMGLLLAAVAIQFMLNALQELKLISLHERV